MSPARQHEVDHFIKMMKATMAMSFGEWIDGHEVPPDRASAMVGLKPLEIPLTASVGEVIDLIATGLMKLERAAVVAWLLRTAEEPRVRSQVAMALDLAARRIASGEHLLGAAKEAAK